VGNLTINDLTSALSDVKQELAKVQLDLLKCQSDQQSAQHLALHDALTSLPNGLFFQQKLDQVLTSVKANASSLAVFFVDLDNFKLINDRHGHAMGDEVLRIVGARLKNTLREDDFVCRAGGDEFTCIIRDFSDRDQVVGVASKMHDVVASPLKIGDVTLNVLPSIGVAIWPEHGFTGEALLKHADVAMYQAKRYQLGHAIFENL
jgi:diguanylate cyclase